MPESGDKRRSGGGPTEEAPSAGRYPFRDLEAKAHRRWVEEHLFEIADPMGAKNPFYCLNMFPYPSGDLHVGHGRNYILGDAVARVKRMQGHSVLAPMGWDAFGLPAENAAIQNQVPPAAWTRRNIDRMKRQLHAWGAMFDWNREIASCDPSYYKWTQWLFLKLYERGLAYRAKGAVNWCPTDQTVLANEQVIDGRCERCDSVVETRELEQWFFKITAYAEALLNDLSLLTEWPEKVRVMQANWIGRSEGAHLEFAIEGETAPLEIFTTRPDTLYGATFMVVAAEHPLVTARIAAGTLPKEAAAFVERLKRARVENRFAVEAEKEGVATGITALHPVTGARLPVWVANYVVMGYGTGAIMAVPAHDQRDFEFATKYRLPIVEVYRPAEGAGFDGKAAFEGEGRMVNSAEFDGLPTPEARKAIVAALAKKGTGEHRVNFRLRDWLISRQRYWGAPIPMVVCPKCGMQPVPESELPVVLPDQVTFKPTGESPLLSNAEFLKAKCPKCHGEARRETDTMDTFVDSSWYFLRFLNPRLESKAFESDAVNRWLPVNQYIGGVEHAILHLLYSRFIVKVLRDMGLVQFSEPFERLFTQGMITKDGHKMSKSKGNVVPPDALIERYGADTVRLYTLFIGPPEKDAEWNDRGVEGAYRFLTRYWRLVEELTEVPEDTPRKPFAPAGPARQFRRRIHELVEQIHDDVDRFHFNTAVSGLMQMVNALQEFQAGGAVGGRAETREALDLATRLLAPLAPHTAEGAWERLGNKNSVATAPWPQADPQALQKDVERLVVQVNGKVRAQIEVPAGATQAQALAAAQADEKVQKFTQGRPPKKVIFVPGKLLNLVVEV
ncbi:MAG TPA: leucine--tRNA ligase [Candidatus Eisenbacteria bacterium]|nr:leucine--tRNA ligase [Candidatus Eisenbacteria bacterium]